MAGISEMYVFLHLSNSHFFFKKNTYHLELGQGKDKLKENQSEDFFP